MTKQTATRQLRSFGLTVGGVFAVIGLWPSVFRSADPRWWALALAGLLAFPALLFPKFLEPAYRGWMFVGHLLGWINTRIIMGMLFFTLFSMIGCILRLMGKDPMHRKMVPGAKTYRVPRPFRPASHMRHQF
jgi:hypothetical protein